MDLSISRSAKEQLSLYQKILFLYPPRSLSPSDAGFYYFYLNGSASEENFEKRFTVPEHADSSIPMFIRGWYSQGPIYFKFDQIDDSQSIFVLGSCVSRDTFETEQTLSLSGYRARTSFAGLHTTGVSGANQAQLNANPSPFQRRMVFGDLTKDALSLVKHAAGNYVLVDFVDERIPLVTDGKTIFSESSEFISSNVKFENLSKLDMYSSTYYRNFARGWLEFMDNLGSKHILVNKIYWAESNTLGEQLAPHEWISKENEKLNQLYAIVSVLAPEIQWIEYPDGVIVADSHHRWGQAPFHYPQEFYNHQAKVLKRFI
ncbi:DUF6270 domain-containing protein [Rothia nasimurium]|uniref:DUF6270 domain-containing protein n=1 Tax=Rothia nasimurium TaxID=85336 RepID=UPI001F2074DC|nr:DUF6270 domain-containing protein [Rothia nasimurium]